MARKGPALPRRELEPLEILLEASQVAADHTLDLDDLLRSLAELVRKVVDYQIFAVLLEDGDGGLYRIRYSIGYRPDFVRRFELESGVGIAGAAIESRRTVLVNDVLRDPRYLMAVDAVRSEMAVPLVARGRVVGVVDLQSAERNAFSEHERNMLELIASRISLAIDAARSHGSTIEQNDLLKTLAQIAYEFSQILRLDELLQKISSLVRGLIRYDAFSIFLLEPDSDALKHYFGVRFDERVQWRSVPLGTGLVGTAAATGRPVLVDDTTKDARYIAAVEGIRSEVAVPLVLKNKVTGVLDMESERPAAFTGNHLRMLTMLAPQIGAAIENARLYEQIEQSRTRMQRDLQAARRLQQSLLPKGFYRFQGVEIAARNLPAREVSGDFFGFYPEEGHALGILNADVSGKGAAAALFAALAGGFLRNLPAARIEPLELLRAVNRELVEHKVDAHYLAAIFAQWRPAESKLIVASAGQPMPLVRRSGRVEIVEMGGTPLGLFDPGVFDVREFTLAPGDVFLTASDGLNESENAAREEYGQQRLAELVAARATASAAELLEAIFDDVASFSGGEAPADDRTVVVLRVVG